MVRLVNNNTITNILNFKILSSLLLQQKVQDNGTRKQACLFSVHLTWHFIGSYLLGKANAWGLGA